MNTNRRLYWLHRISGIKQRINWYVLPYNSILEMFFWKKLLLVALVAFVIADDT
jgi:hypothetical protein